MNAPIEIALQQALEQCASEPIHQLGFIQPHGFAIVLSPSADYTILQASANLADWLDMSAELALNKSLNVVLGIRAAQQIAQLIAEARLAHSNTAIGIVDIVTHAINKLDAHVFMSDGFPVVELCDDSGIFKSEDFTAMLLKNQALLLEDQGDEPLVDYLQKTAAAVRDMLAYDNVMIYRFDENWDGQVIAQCRSEAAHDYLGTYFPASDIPPQARALYVQNVVRVLTDVDAEPVGLVPVLNPQTHSPLNLTMSCLRSLSPIHIQYLKNMGTGATITISLMQNGKLWGLIACHHLSPKRVSIIMRQRAALISKMISTQLLKLEQVKKQSLTNKFLELNVEIVSLLSKISKHLYKDLLPELMALLDASGIIVIVDGERFMSGITPAHGDITALLDWLSHQIKDGYFVSSNLSNDYPASQPYKAQVSGLLTIVPTHHMQNCIIWLRQEKIQTVNWAGAYSQGLTQSVSGQYQLTPRQSFETWSEIWQGRADPWTADEVILAQLFKRSLSSFQETHQLKKEIADVKQSHEELINLIPSGIILADPKRRITFVNKDFERFTGYSQAELIGNFCSLLQGPDTDPKQIQNIRATLNAQKSFCGEILNYRKDGSSYWNELTVSPIFNHQNQLTQFVGVMRDITEKKLQQDAIAHSEQRFRELSNVAPTLIWQADIHKNRYWFNKGWLVFTGRSLEEEAGDGWIQGIHPEDTHRVITTFHAAFERRENFYVEYRLRRADGDYRWIDGYGVPQFSDEGDFEGYVGTCTDVTEVRNSKAATDFFNVAHEMIYTTDLKGIILDCNQRFSEVTGYARDEVVGKFVNILKSGQHDQEFYSQMWKAIHSEGVWCGELINRKKTGELSTVITTISVVLDSHGKPHRYLAVASDISTLTEKRKQLEHLAYYDNLTGLANRTLLMDRLKHAMSRVKRQGGFMAVLFIDLDGFKAINDYYGHNVGDDFLVVISQEIKSTVRGTDILARLGGDEFVIVLEGLTYNQDLKSIILNLLAVCSADVSIRGVKLNVTASIGIRIYPADPEGYVIDAEALVRQADQAMYVAKAKGKNGFHYFDRIQDEIIITRNNAIQSLQKGLIDGDFELFYQPKVNMSTGKVYGFESLIRWNKNQSELIEPAQFLPIVQNDPLGIELGNWVIKTALAQLSDWHKQGLETTISINVDARQLMQSGFVEYLKVEMSGLPFYQPGSIVLEILETIAIDDRIKVIDVINRCGILGVEFALDDFGTGYSSITYLKELPIKTLKIDRSFIAGISHSNQDLKLVANMLRLASDMGKQVIAEGVETIEQGELLIKVGCEMGQGYAIAKPMAADAVWSWLREWQPCTAWQTSTNTDRLSP